MDIQTLEKIRAEHKNAVEIKRRQFAEKNNTPFFKGQTRLALRNVEIINPCAIAEYIAADGYFGLHKALTQMSREDIIKTVAESGLRGRGGAGFPTGKKWQFVYDAKDDTKYVICNADEGDPGAFMDRAVLENDPHSVLEAMTIAGFAVGAQKGFIYVRAEYPTAVANLQTAIKQSKEHGLLGSNIFGTSFSFDIELRLGAGAFVCGEETALIASIEGRRGEPLPKPPFPANSGLYKKPTLINNVETYCSVPMIIYRGPEYWNTVGTANCRGTKVFALAGNISNGGLVEVPMGTTLHRLVHEIGGGAPNGRSVKAVQTGGPSGGCVPASMFDIKLDFDEIKKVGSILGSGGLVVMDDKTCMVDIAKFFIKFSIDESCGKCAPCRIGNRKLLNILEKISSGKGEESDLNKLTELGETIMSTSLCGLGQSSPSPVVSTVTYFKDEYLEHIRNKRCPAGVCSELTQFVIGNKCVGCGACKRACPVGCISGELRKTHEIDQTRCIKCSRCASICPVSAVCKQ